MAYEVISSQRGTVTQYTTGRREILIDSAADVPNLPEDCAPGSLAYTADMSYVVQRDNHGQWVQVGGA